MTGSANVSTQVWGGAAGADYHYSPSTVFGFALAGAGTNWDMSAGLGGGRSDAFQAGVFVRHFEGPWYLALAGAFGVHDVTTNRDVVVAGAGSHYNASYTAHTYALRAETGYRTSWGSYGFTPYAAVQSQIINLPSYTENTTFGAPTFALAFAHHSVTDTRTELGTWVDYRVFSRETPVTLFARAAWVHDYDTNRIANATFTTLPGASFMVNGASATPDSALTSLGAKVAMADHWTLTGKVDGEFGGGSTTYAVTGKLSKAW